MVNALGQRFVDEGADFRNYTYAKYGRIVLEQPQQFAWQVFDAKVSHLVRDEYRIKQVTRVKANTLEGLAEKLEGVDRCGFLDMIRLYNAAVDQSMPFNPNVKDSRGTCGITPSKSNWTNTIDTPPFKAWKVPCGLTFSIGCIGANTSAQMLDTDPKPIPGLYAAGDLVGGLFYINYSGGTGLMSGAVFGRTAGTSAARAVARVLTAAK